MKVLVMENKTSIKTVEIIANEGKSLPLECKQLSRKDKDLVFPPKIMIVVSKSPYAMIMAIVILSDAKNLKNTF